MAEFVTVARARDVREGLSAFDVAGARVAVAKIGDSFHAFDDTCPHAQCSLAEGDLEGTTVACPCHGSRFDVRTGAVLAPPARQPVRSHRVRVEGESLQIEP